MASCPVYQPPSDVNSMPIIPFSSTLNAFESKLLLVEGVEALSDSRLVAVSKLLAVEISVGDVLFDSDLSVVEAVADDISFGSDSLLNVVSDDKGVWCSSGFEVVSAVVTNVVSLVASSLVVSAVTTSKFWLFSRSDWATEAAGNCVVFSGN
jgi:hypothetical protein